MVGLMSDQSNGYFKLTNPRVTPIMSPTIADAKIMIIPILSLMFKRFIKQPPMVDDYG